MAWPGTVGSGTVQVAYSPPKSATLTQALIDPPFPDANGTPEVFKFVDPRGAAHVFDGVLIAAVTLAFTVSYM
jgi:hypothetical protein